MNSGKKLKTYLAAALLFGLLSLSACSSGSDDPAPTTTNDNSSLNGAWLLVAQTQGEHDVYLVSDGLGDITDFGAFLSDTEIAASTYSASSNGSLSLTIAETSGSFFATGQLTSSTAGSLTFGTAPDTMVFDLAKVSDLAALEGSWAGTLTEDASPNTAYNVTIAVNSSGEITSLTGFAMPVSGKLYYESGKIAGFVRTAEPSNNPYNQIHINGTLANGVTINGTYGYDGGGGGFDGTLTLTKL